MQPWVLEVKFDKQHHLFSNLINTNYKVTTLICNCGKQKFIVSHALQNIEYICEDCENDFFLNANDALFSIQNFLYTYNYSKFNYDIDIEHMPHKTTASYSISIPNEIDFLCEKVFYKKVVIFSFTFDNTNKQYETYETEYEDKIFQLLKSKLNSFICDNQVLYNIPKNTNIKLTTRIASFFLAYPYFIDFEFYYWENTNKFHKKGIDISKALGLVSNDRKEKSIKKAIYNNYIYQIQNLNKYYHSVINLFCEKIQDPDIVVQSINMDISSIQFTKIDLSNIELLLKFLQLYYSDKQIINALQSINTQEENNIFIDLLNEFRNAYDYLDQMFIKVRCSIKILHDEFTRCSYEYNYKEIYGKLLSYTEQDIKLCKTVLEYDIKLPFSGTELLEWANSLHNCMAGYFNQIKSNHSIIYGFFKNNEIVFAVEIAEARIVQSSGKYNKYLDDTQERVLKLWFDSCQQDLAEKMKLESYNDNEVSIPDIDL